MDNAKSKSNMQEGAYPEKKRKSAADQFAANTPRSSIGQKRITGLQTLF
jgi:hypothetical protein